jgi:hypothetical protein
MRTKQRQNHGVELKEQIEIIVQGNCFEGLEVRLWT